jgi:hypothetical protein
VTAHLPRPVRAAATFAALALFLTGSNYCLVGALRGTPMSCTVIAGSTSSKAEAAPICPLHARKAKGAPASKTASAAPCCVTLARADAPEVPRIDAAPMPFAALAVIAAALDPNAQTASPHFLPLDQHPPAPGWEKSAHAGRAPPTLA